MKKLFEIGEEGWFFWVVNNECLVYDFGRVEGIGNKFIKIKTSKKGIQLISENQLGGFYVTPEAKSTLNNVDTEEAEEMERLYKHNL